MDEQLRSDLRDLDRQLDGGLDADDYLASLLLVVGRAARRAMLRGEVTMAGLRRMKSVAGVLLVAAIAVSDDAEDGAGA